MATKIENFDLVRSYVKELKQNSFTNTDVVKHFENRLNYEQVKKFLQGLEELEFGTEELSKVVENVGNSNFAKFEVGKPYVVEIMSSKINPREAEFDGKKSVRYDLQVKVNNEEKVWSVSKTVLKTIADNWEVSKKFNVMRGEGNKGYNVIPLIEA